MKKILLFLVLAMLMMMILPACSAGDQTTSTSTVQETTAIEGSSVESDKTPEKFKIGFSSWASTDPYAAEMIEMLEYVCDATGSELVYLDWVGYDAEGILATYQNLIEAGCDGLITVTITPAMLQLCEDKNVPIMLTHGTITDENTLQMARDSSVFAGMLMQNDYEAGKLMAQALKDNGSSNIAYIGPAVGMAPQEDERYRGLKDFIAENPDMKFITEDRSGNPEAIVQMLTAFPEVDGVQMDTAASIVPVVSAGLQDQVKVATANAMDMASSLEDGMLVWTAGTEASAQLVGLSYAVLYNFMTGNDMIADKTQLIQCPFIVMTNADEYQDYVKYCAGDVPIYTADEIKNLITAFNPDATYESLAELIKNTTLDDIVVRHADLVK